MACETCNNSGHDDRRWGARWDAANRQSSALREVEGRTAGAWARRWREAGSTGTAIRNIDISILQDASGAGISSRELIFDPTHGGPSQICNRILAELIARAKCAMWAAQTAEMYTWGCGCDYTCTGVAENLSVDADCVAHGNCHIECQGCAC